MPFTIPNLVDAADPTQAQVDSVDFGILAAGAQMSGIFSGCAVSAQGTPDMTVAVAAGVVSVNGLTTAVTAGNVSITAANATNPRFDLVVVNNIGTKSVVAGTASAIPVFPAIPANSVILAAVWIPANDTVINANQIVDKRVILMPQYVPRMQANVQWFYVPVGQIGTGTGVANALRVSSIIFPGGITLDRLGLEVTTAGAGSAIRLGIYADSGYGYPGALILDAGTIDSSTLGNKEITISQVISTPGLYWMACVGQGGTAPAYRTYSLNSSPPIPILTTFVTAPPANALSGYEVTGVSGALPNPFGTVPLTPTTNGPRTYVRVA